MVTPLIFSSHKICFDSAGEVRYSIGGLTIKNINVGDLECVIKVPGTLGCA